MHDHYAFREIIRRTARRSAGASPYGSRITVGQTAASALDNEIQAMPFDGDRGSILHVDGTWKFTLGFSQLDGPDTLG